MVGSDRRECPVPRCVEGRVCCGDLSRRLVLLDGSRAIRRAIETLASPRQCVRTWLVSSVLLLSLASAGGASIVEGSGGLGSQRELVPIAGKAGGERSRQSVSLKSGSTVPGSVHVSPAVRVS